MATTSEDGNAADIKRALLEKKVRQRVAERAERERIVAVPRTDKMAIADQQRFLWFLHQMVAGAPVYNVPFAMRLRGPLDVAALSKAFRGIVSRHESLRTRFGDEHGVPFLTIDPPPETWDLPVEDGTEDSVQEWIDAQVRPPFDLREGRPYRFALLRLGPEDHVLSIVWHHIVIDGWSSRQFAEELTERYADPDGAAFPELTLQPADYAAWQRLWLLSEEPAKQIDYWRETLDGIEPLNVRGDRPRPAAPTGEGRIFETSLPDDLARRLRARAQDEGVSLLALMMAGYQVVMSRYTGQDDIALGSVLSGRTRSEIESMMGFFANTVPIRASLEGNPVFRDLAQNTNNTILDAMARQDVPFGRLVEALSPQRVPGQNPLVHHLFTLLPEPMIARWQLPGVDVEMLTAQPATTRFDITFQVNDLPDGRLGVWIEYSSELFDQERIERLVEHFVTVMSDGLSRPDARVDTLDLMPDDEYTRVLAEWNPPPGKSDGRLLHELVAARVAETPDAVAMRFAGEDLTYAQLDEQSNRLAHTLVDEFKVVPGYVVGVLLERGFDLPAAELGVLKAGGAWLPLDPQYPSDRLAYQLEDADVAAVVTTSDLADRVPADVGRILLDTDVLDDRTVSPSVPVAQEDGAYVIYTSGSTGTPKGVIVPHRAVVNFCTTFGDMFSVTPDDRILQFSNPAFDVSVSDVFSTLTAGGTIVGAPRSELLDPDTLQQLLARERVTMVDIPPAVLRSLDPSTLDDLRVCFIGMEPFGPDLVNRWSKPGREFHNGYGPTEVTVTCVDYLCPPEPLDGTPPIGRAMANQRAYVLDKGLRPVPIGVPGELFMAGAGLAVGYLGRPDQTAEKFVPDPFAVDPGERMYATGDLVRWNAEGQIEFLGRVDRQVKLRGLRVELGEIEHAVESFPDAQQAVVTVRDEGTSSAWLAAHVVGEFEQDVLRDYLTERLPLHMVPTVYVALEQMPMTPTGKVDHAKLPDPRPAGDDIGGAELTTETQRQVAEIWQSLLSLEPGSVGAQDNFFLLGGNSLQVTQLVSRIRDTFQVTLDPRRLFSYPVLSQFAARIDDAQRELLGENEIEQLKAEIADLPEEELDRLLKESR